MCLTVQPLIFHYLHIRFSAPQRISEALLLLHSVLQLPFACREPRRQNGLGTSYSGGLACQHAPLGARGVVGEGKHHGGILPVLLRWRRQAWASWRSGPMSSPMPLGAGGFASLLSKGVLGPDFCTSADKNKCNPWCGCKVALSRVLGVPEH